VRPAIQQYRQARVGASGWARDYLRQQFRNEFGGDSPPDWKIRTTFDKNVQAAAEQAVAAGLKRLNTRGLEAAFVAIDPQTGDILAMVGGGDYAASTFNRATRSKRQPGSAFKPILYAARCRTASRRSRCCQACRTCPFPAIRNGCRRMPITRKQADALTLRAALVESNNAAAADLQQRVGSAPCCGWRRMPDWTSCRTCHRSRSAAGSDAARSDVGVRGLCRWRTARDAPRHDVGLGPGRC
jgi:penicillin-binding protein 1A